jgi:hypothetical protein
MSCFAAMASTNNNRRAAETRWSGVDDPFVRSLEG